MAGGSRIIAISTAALAVLVSCVFLLVGTEGAQASAQPAQQAQGGRDNFLGVATCGGSTCHGRSVPNWPMTGPEPPEGAARGVVRQDEILIWQDPASAAGAHSRAFAVLQEPRSREITRKLGLGEPTTAAACLGCHATPGPSAFYGPRFLRSDGVSCEACHGAASRWLSYHYSVGATHTGNIARGLTALENPRARAEVCLDCHFGNQDRNRFVTHEIMAAGHPRISFELDLFTTLQAHHDDDDDYRERKARTSNVQVWAVGQSLALERSLELFNSDRGRQGIFPEFYFLDCHSCHRRIYDGPTSAERLTVLANPGRPITFGMPPYNDENMIMLSAALRVVNAPLGRRFDTATEAFHRAMTGDRAAMRPAVDRLRATAAELADYFARNPISNEQVFRIVDAITSQAISERFTDYAGSVQAVMATDTLLSALVAERVISQEQVQGIRGDINAAYQAVRDPTDYDPIRFRASLGRAAAAIRRLR